MLLVRQTVPVQVWVDIDIAAAETVRYLNTIPGVRTWAMYQEPETGTETARPVIMCAWPNTSILHQLQLLFDITIEGDNWGYARLKIDG
jgi:hypothetical protein